MDTADPIGTPHSFGAFLVCALRTGRRFKSYYMNLFLNYTVLRDPHRRGGGCGGLVSPPHADLQRGRHCCAARCTVGQKTEATSANTADTTETRQRAPASLRAFLGPCTPVNDFFCYKKCRVSLWKGREEGMHIRAGSPNCKVEGSNPTP